MLLLLPLPMLQLRYLFFSVAAPTPFWNRWIECQSTPPSPTLPKSTWWRPNTVYYIQTSKAAKRKRSRGKKYVRMLALASDAALSAPFRAKDKIVFQSYELIWRAASLCIYCAIKRIFFFCFLFFDIIDDTIGPCLSRAGFESLMKKNSYKIKIFI